jgi:3-phenylpropionate/cinnamic acid dioxygenase small subunit
MTDTLVRTTSEMDTRPTLERAGVELQHEIEQFLYYEAELLDERRFDEWLELLADDLHYWMPTRGNRARKEMHKEFAGPREAAFFDEDKDSMVRRVRRIDTGMAWAEDPPSRTRHMVSNVRVLATENENELEARCAYLLYRSRLERDVEIFVGARRDVLRRVDEGVGWQIARRTIILDQATLLAKNLSVFF